MIKFHDWELSSDSRTIGYQYDHNTRVLLVSGDLPEGWSWELLVQVRGNFDILPLEPMGEGFGVKLTRDQLGVSGFYKLQLRGTLGDQVRHTNQVSLSVRESMSGDAHWPVLPIEFTKMEERVRSEADRTSQIARGVLQVRTDTEGYSRDAEKSAKQARESQQMSAYIFESVKEQADSAEQAVQRAEAAADRAETGAGAQIDDAAPAANKVYSSQKVSGLLDEKQPKGEYLTQETDPTVPEWAKRPSKPTYTAEEVGALPDSTEALKNPHALTFTGAVSAAYDGSAPVSVEIPAGGGTGSSFVRDIPCENGVADITANRDMQPDRSREWQRFTVPENYYGNIRIKIHGKELDTGVTGSLLLLATMEIIAGESTKVTQRYFDPAQNKEYRWVYTLSNETGTIVGDVTAEIVSVEEQISGLSATKLDGPAPAAEDEGKVLTVVDGKAVWMAGSTPPTPPTPSTAYHVTYALTKASSSNREASVKENTSYTTTLTADEGLTLSGVSVTMGGKNITAQAWKAPAVTISAVTGDVVITAEGVSAAQIDTSPKLAEREAALDPKGNILHEKDFASQPIYQPVVKNFGITDFYNIQSGDNKIWYYGGYHVPETPGLGAKGPKHQLFKDGVYADYYTPKWNEETGMAVIKSSNQFRTTLALDGLDDSYAYSMPSGAIYYAGKNTKYYGKQNINGKVPAAVSKARAVDRAYSMDALSAGADEVKIYPGLTPEYVQMVTDNYHAMMAEARGDYDRIPFVIHTDQHGRVRASNHVFDLIGDLTDWYEVSKCINLGDTSSTVFDAGQLQTYLDVLHDHIPYSKRVELYGNHDVWQKVDGNMNYELPQKKLSPYFKNIYGRRFSNQGYFTTIDRWYNVKYLCISDYEYADNSSARRMTTAQANFFVDELSRDDGYDIILCAHQPLDGNKDWITRDPTATPYVETFLSDPTANASLLAMIKARHDFTTGTFTDSEGGKHPYDFTKLKSKLLTQISGHAHFEAYYTLPGSITEFIFDWFDGNTFYWGYIDRKAMKMVFWKNATDAGNGRLEVPLA